MVHHDAIRQGGDIPTWKYCYESRNMLYDHLLIKHRVGRYPRKIITLFLRALLRQRGGRIGCVSAICRGLYDGAFGCLRIRYQLDPLHERDLSPSGFTGRPVRFDHLLDLLEHAFPQTIPSRTPAPVRAS